MPYSLDCHGGVMAMYHCALENITVVVGGREMQGWDDLGETSGVDVQEEERGGGNAPNSFDCTRDGHKLFTGTDCKCNARRVVGSARVEYMYIRNQRYVCVGMHAAAAEDQCQERSRERKPDLLNILRQSYGRYAVNIYSYYY